MVAAGYIPTRLDTLDAESSRSSEELHNPDGIMLMFADSGHCRSRWQVAPGRLFSSLWEVGRA